MEENLYQGFVIIGTGDYDFNSSDSESESGLPGRGVSVDPIPVSDAHVGESIGARPVPAVSNNQDTNNTVTCEIDEDEFCVITINKCFPERSALDLNLNVQPIEESGTHNNQAPSEPELNTLPPEPEPNTLPPEPELSTLPPEPELSTLPPEPELNTPSAEPELSTLPPEPELNTPSAEPELNSCVSECTDPSLPTDGSVKMILPLHSPVIVVDCHWFLLQQETDDFERLNSYGIIN